ncbi:MAG: uroporphyrinogen decarboxylase family protein [Tannerella sp.]|jgi:hypothetical protein|nr:uroporphyrinogen decarboxylase family protein [Tannerella sp.]
MMAFDTTKRDSQATDIIPVRADQFDMDRYVAYESELLKKTHAFMKSASGVLVYRRMRAADVFSAGCRDVRRSLELQLGCLQKSMDFNADIPNFLEPWYGIGVCASAYGIDYIWNEGQAPAVAPAFDTVHEALQYSPSPIAETTIGKDVMNMIDYFLNQTKGKLPISFTDAQSPLNVSTMIVNNTNLLMDTLLDPDAVRAFLDILADLTIDFAQKQQALIGDCLVNPGHGFASARNFEGYGQSDDNIVMLSNEQYIDCALPSFEKVGQKLGGAVLHSCGNWSDKIPVLREINTLRMVDAAFSAETDPHPNPALPFVDALVNTGIVLNARIVGGLDVIEKTVRTLWRPGMKLIVVTYCSTPEEQERAYHLIHEICS